MTKFITLVGLAFKQQFLVKPTEEGKGKKVGTIVLYVVMALIFVPILITIFVGCLNFGALTKQMNMSQEQLRNVVGSLLVVAQGAVLLFGFSSVISNVFNCRDADKLMYLPVSARTIFLSKFFVAYLNEMLTAVVILLCTVLPFGIGAGFGVGYYILVVLSFVLVPLLPMFVATIVAMPISLLMSKIGKNGTVRTIFNVVLYLAFMVLYIVFVQSMNNIGGEGDVDDISQLILSVVDRMGAVVKYIHPDYLLAGAFVAASFVSGFVNAIAAVGEYVVLAALLFVVAKLFYGKMLAMTVEGDGTSKKKLAKGELKLNKKGGVLRNLISADFKRVVRSPQLGFQAFAGMIVAPLVVVFLGLGFSFEADDGQMIALKDLAGEFGIYFSVGIMAYLSLIAGGTNVFGLFPISRENKSLYLLKTLPVPFSKILLAKVVLATIVMVVIDAVTALVTVFMWGISPLTAVLMTVGLFFFGFGNMCFTTKGDLKNPKLGWSNFQTSVKNSKNSWFAMLLGLICALLVGVTSIGFFVWHAAVGKKYIEYIMWIAIDIVGALYAYVAYRIMNSSAEQLFERIEP